MGGGSVRRWIGALAVAVVLGMGPVACGGGDGPTGKSAADPYPAQRDQLLAHLKGTSQGAHVTGVAISPQNSKTDMRIDIDTDFPAFGPTDYSPATDAIRDQGGKIAREAEEWLVDHRPEGMASGVIRVRHSGRELVAVDKLPFDGDEQERSDRLAADLLARLRALPEGSHVTRVALKAGTGLDVVIATDLEPYVALDNTLEPADAGPRAQIGRALLAAAVTWARELPAADTIDAVYLLDRVKGIADIDDPYPCCS